MRSASALVLFTFLFCGHCFAQDGVNPQDQPRWYTTGGTWGQWTPIKDFPGLSVRGACGDDTQLNGVPMFTLYTQIRSAFAYPIAMVWSEEMYDQKTKKNIVSGSFLEYLEPKQITEGISELAGNCPATRIFYAKVKCVARKGEGGTACFRTRNGDPVPLRTTMDFHSRPSLTTRADGNRRRVPNSFANSVWNCDLKDDEGPYYGSMRFTFHSDGSWTCLRTAYNGRPAPADDWCITEPDVDKWQQHGTEITWLYSRLTPDPFFKLTVAGNSMAGAYYTRPPDDKRVGTIACTLASTN